MSLRWPSSQDEIFKIQVERKRMAVERALQAPFFRQRLKHIDLNRVEEQWLEIPVLTKEELRGIAPERYHEEFCIQPRTAAVEYWRSGGATGRPAPISSGAGAVGSL